MNTFLVLLALLGVAFAQKKCHDLKNREECLSTKATNIFGGVSSCAFCDGFACESSLRATADAFMKGSKCEFPKEVSYLFSGKAAASTCESFNSDKSKCLTATEGGDKCAYCTSGAVGSECIKETDAKGLPSSVFQCSYAALAATAASTCESFNSDKSKCLAATEGGDKCAYCTSGAVGSECIKETDAKGLPSSVFQCAYAKSYLRM